MQYKKIVLGALVGIGMVGSLMPVMAAAITTTELVNLFVALGIIAPDKAAAALQAVGNADTAGITTVTPASSSSAGACPALTRALRMGMRDTTTNGEVTKLQLYLQSAGDFTYPTITGFYGNATVQAVQKWQVRNKVVSSGSSEMTGYGAVGPLTRMGILNSCKQIVKSCPNIMPPQCTNGTLVSNGNDANGCSLGYQCKANPVSVSCPLIYPPQCTNGALVSSGTDANGCSLGYQCKPSPVTVTCPIVDPLQCTNGTIVSRGNDTNGCSLGYRCVVPVTTQSALNASPTSGSAPLTVNFTGSVTTSGTAGYSLYFGDSDKAAGHVTSTLSTVTQTHTYSVAGTYYAKLYKTGFSPDKCADCQPVASVTITVSAKNTSGTLSVSPDDAIDSNRTLIYSSTASWFGGVSLDYGDGTSALVCNPGGSCSGSKSRVYSIGSYTARLLGIGEGGSTVIATKSFIVRPGI